MLRALAGSAARQVNAAALPDRVMVDPFTKPIVPAEVAAVATLAVIDVDTVTLPA
jgi:hypothetical protein